MNREQLGLALAALGLTGAQFARIVNHHAGTNLHASHISRMTSSAASGRQPSPAVRAVASLLLHNQAAAKRIAADAQAIARPLPE